MGVGVRWPPSTNRARCSTRQTEAFRDVCTPKCTPSGTRGNVKCVPAINVTASVARTKGKMLEPDPVVIVPSGGWQTWGKRLTTRGKAGIGAVVAVTVATVGWLRSRASGPEGEVAAEAVTHAGTTVVEAIQKHARKVVKSAGTFG
jgi:hypothetical protein